jgi:Zn-dependent protease with chaperone function
MKRLVAWFLVIAVTVGPLPARAGEEEKVEGYAEWRRADVLLVDGQRVRPAASAKFKGGGEARSFVSIPLGYEVKAKGVRLADGTLLAREIEAKPNGKALFESDLREAFDELEEKFRRRGRMYEEDDDGDYEEYGRLREAGPEVERVRAITRDLVPPYLDPDDYRVYVIENKEWNAMAAPNGSIYVFTGLIDAMDDDELAIILGHELAHATHEHSRKQFKKDIVIQLAALGVIAAAETIDSKTKRTILQVGTLLAASAWKNGYGRGHEDQADRVGLRYAYEAGYDVGKGPRLWQRFADRYGNLPGVVNFFLSDHSQSKVRSRNLQRELALNYVRS